MPSHQQQQQLILAAVSTVAVATLTWYLYQKSSAKRSVPPVTRGFRDKQQLSDELCAAVAQEIQSVLTERGSCYMAVANDDILLSTLAGLSKSKNIIDFSKVTLAVVDQLCVAPDDTERSTLSKAKAHFATAVGITKFVIPHAKPKTGSDGRIEAAFYKTALVTANVPLDYKTGTPILDLVLLGLNRDGQLGASIRPYSLVARSKCTQPVTAVTLPGSVNGTTLTLETIAAARRVMVLASTQRAVQKALERPVKKTAAVPAQSLWSKHGPVVYYYLEVEDK